VVRVFVLRDGTKLFTRGLGVILKVNITKYIFFLYMR
jgi:hypothetical protein